MDLNRIVGANVVLINGLQPSNIVVSVSDKVNVQLGGMDTRRSVVDHELRLPAQNSAQSDQEGQNLDRHGEKSPRAAF